jgi:plasmid stability protein
LGLKIAQFILRDLEETVKVRLKRRAARHGRSMEDEVRHIRATRSRNRIATSASSAHALLRVLPKRV